MGIGAAFATGLIGGLTRNMEREYEKRQTDQQKIDAVQTLLTEYAMKPADEKSATGVNAVRDMLVSARKEVEGRPRVGLLGQRSPELELDIGKLSATMDAVSAYEFYVGSGDNKIGFNIKRPDKIDVATGRAIFAEVGRHMGDEVTRLKYIADPNAYNTVNQLIHQGIAAYDTAMLNSPERKENFMFAIETEPWWDAWQEVGKLNKAKAISPNQTRTETLQNQNPDANVLGVVKAEVIDVDGQKKIAIGPVTFDGTDNPGLLEQSYSALGTKLKAADPQSVFDAYAANIDVFNIPGETQIDYFEDSISLGANATKIGALAPGKGLYSVVDDATSTRQEKYAQQLNTLNQYNSTGTFENAVYMLYPHFIERNKPRLSGSFKAVSQLGNSQEYVVRLHYGAEESQKYSFASMETERDANYNVMMGLNNLALKRATLDESVAYSQMKDVLRFGGEFLVDIGSDLGFLNGVNLTQAQRDSIQIGMDPTKSITSEFLAELQGQLQAARDKDASSEYSTGSDVTFAELMSLRIGLAFQMARAADPSGRLSDQDVRQQLERLMGNFDNTGQALAKIGIVAKEFEQRYKKLQVLTYYGKGDGRRMTPESKAVIDAAVSYDYILRQGQLGDGSTISMSDYTDDEIDEFFLTSNNEPVYRRYKDGYSTDALTDQNGDDQLFTKQVLSDGKTKYTAISRDNLIRRSEMTPQVNPTVDTAGRPVPENEALLTGPRMNPTVDTAGRLVARNPETGPRINPSVDTAGRPVPVVGPRINPSVDTAGRPVEENEFPGLTDEEAEIIRGLRGGQDEEDMIFDPENIPRRGDPRRRVKPRPQRPVDPEGDILPGEPGSGTEEGATRAARGPDRRPRARPLPDAEPPAPELPAGAEADEGDDLGFTPKTNVTLNEGEFSPKTHQRAGPGSNDTGFPIKKRGSQELEDGKFRLENGKFVPVEAM
jgi:hypothetical protein